MKRTSPIVLFLLCTIILRTTQAQSAPPDDWVGTPVVRQARPAKVQPTSPAPARKDIPSIAKAANGAIVTIVTGVDDKPIALGTGFIVSTDGVIVTNYHVIKTGNVAAAKFPDGSVLKVDGVVAADKNRDLAIIKVHGKLFHTLPLGDSDQIQIGQDVVAIGNPLGLELTVSNGILSGVRTDEKEGGKFLQTTAPISHGSSGGPLFNMRGQVIGINSMYYEGGENLNFAIPINEAKHLLNNQSAKLQSLPNEPPDTPVSPNVEIHTGTLAQQKACKEEAEPEFAKFIKFNGTGYYTSHFDPSSGICFMEMSTDRYPNSSDTPIWIYGRHVDNVLENRIVGQFSQVYIHTDQNSKIDAPYKARGGPFCIVSPPGQPEVTCKTEQEFDYLTLKYFGLTQY